MPKGNIPKPVLSLVPQIFIVGVRLLISPCAMEIAKRSTRRNRGVVEPPFIVVGFALG